MTFGRSTNTRVAVVMPVRNEEDAIDATLDAIFQSTVLPDEIIVSDGMSTDETVSKIHEYCQLHKVDIKIVKNPTFFCGGGRNIAISTTTCDIILLSDFGNIVRPDWIECMVRPFMQDASVDIVAGMFKPLVTSDFEHCMGAIHYFEDYTLDQLTDEERQALVPDVKLPGGLSIGFTRAIWEKVEGFPEWLAKGQDKMFSRKAHALGAKVEIAWDACIEHHMRPNPSQVFRQLFFYGRGNGQMRFISSHFPKLAIFYAFVVVLIVLSTVYNSLVLASIFLLMAYYLKSGLSKVWRIPGSKRKVSHIWISAMVLFPRDIGTILGHVVGWYEWFFVPKYQLLYNNYTKYCSDKIKVKV